MAAAERDGEWRRALLRVGRAGEAAAGLVAERRMLRGRSLKDSEAAAEAAAGLTACRWVWVWL